MKLWNMNVYTKKKVLFKFSSLETVCVEIRSKKLFKLSLYQYMYSLVYNSTRTHSTPNALSLDYETLEYECVH